MSRDAENPVPPRRPKKPAGPRPSPSGQGAPGGEPTTWQPNPKKAAPAGNAPRSRAEPERVEGGNNWWERILFGRVGSGQLEIFCRQFAAYLDAGVDILKALKSLEKQFARTALGPVIGRLASGVRGGSPFDEIVAREPQAFDPLFVSMIKVAEARGGMPETLRGLARHYEARQRLIRQARSAMIYPVTVMVVASAVIAFLTIWLLPKFADMLKEIAGPHAALPLPSRILMGLSGFVQWIGWWAIPLAMIGLPVIGFQIYRTGAGKRAMDELVLYVPVFGKLLRKIDTTRFARTLAALLGAGVDIGTSLDLTAEVVRLSPFRRVLVGARSAVMEGGELSEALASSGRFGPDVIAIIGSGEETGKLPESLDRLADDYEDQVYYMVKNMGQLVQPLLMIFLGLVVLFIILAVLLPYISMLSSLSAGS